MKTERWQKSNLLKSLNSRRVIYISGPRQCGKTTLARELAGEDAEYVTLDDVEHLNAAKTDPKSFVKKKKKIMVIDEIQKAPELLPAIKLVVDEDTRPGQYVLTGSVNIFSVPTAHESLAGRIKYLRLRPFTQGEINGTKPTYLDRFFEEAFLDGDSETDKDAILSLALKGGFPEPQLFNNQERWDWYRDYMTSLLERDLRDISKIHRLDKLSELIEVAAAWSSKFLDINAICSKLDVQRSTIENYFFVLKSLYVVEDVKPWVNTDYERVGKKSKFFMTDCGLMAKNLNLTLSDVRLNADQTGKLIETFVANELHACIDCTNYKYRLFHYRDREQREIDFIVEREGNALLGIEVKAGISVSLKSFAHLKWFRDNIAKEKSFVGIILYTGHRVICFEPGMWAVPMSNLWME